MNYYLQIDYRSFGQKVLFGIINGRNWLENKVIFPRIVYCDFTIRYLGDNNPNYTVRKSPSMILLIQIDVSF